MRPRYLPIIWLVAASIIATAVYWPGLNGPFLMDDGQHLELIQSWQQGQIDFWGVAASNGNWLFHRSLAMISLAANVAIGGETSFSLKLGNLLLHLICGWVAYATLQRMLARDKTLGPHANLMSALICAIWLLHPLNVSTVLYVVQRMSQIATLFPLLGVWLYVSVRNRVLAGTISELRAGVLLFVGIPLLTFLGIQGKQSAIVLIGLCLVVELGWLQQPREWPPMLRWLFSILLLLPLLLITCLLIWKWQSLQSAMLEWGMTPAERLLSQPRALWDYCRMLLVPYSPAMGIYNDDFRISHNLTDPITTLPALVGLIVVSLACVVVRKRLPGVFVGWFWFLVAHSVEASIVPIELYYEHRNYLPQIGIWLMAVSLVTAALQALGRHGVRVRAIGWLISLGFIAVISGQTLSRAFVWKTSLGISMAAIDTHPSSTRASVAFGFAAMQAGLVQDTYNVFQRLAANDDRGVAGVGKIELTVLNCYLNKDSDPALLHSAAERHPRSVNPVMPYAVSNLVEIRQRDGCGRITPRLLADTIVSIVDQAVDTRDTSQPKVTLRYNAALAYYQAGDWQLALQQSQLAWPYSKDPSIALFHVKLLLHQDDLAGAKKAFWELMQRAGYERLGQLPGAARGVALRAMLKEINGYAANKALPGLTETETGTAK
ncbi:hypothetical protein [Xanthomonas campestris]|uniref:hypothetical protein n=1 Tax=Xanthomonas campestris TaxID=339 RepID=UPI002367CD2F|nr:hypothetical protein [Xanthomonas campestris]WDI92816.1 hypothetical protein JH280_16285 [Xanthomonas campestris]